VTGRAAGPVLRLLVIAMATPPGLAACAETTIDPTATTVAPGDAPPTTRFDPAGTTAELLDQLAVETGALSDLLVANSGQHEALARIETLWARIRPTIEEERPELLGGFDTVIELVRTSVARRRPADADKADKNLATLIVVYNS
jgi:hypothetical protein